ncbi:pancreatic secretory granule membrane major glycoprotein GP2-like isoform X1 [Danio rerio]|uniref:Pancreatic secretory granule membrane major glycoprotein GP2-like isoform X1 n=1 Tax=Danio rerio TaxID=7955 RepID=X1WE05_DANRE|nr:pancreatic secretory granule membrane major glycoprotein GP2-like isoform X1 [Danio rerio]|eukprot:XP_017214057.1 pancreatic secretory granule membrane major glycoprotein GP2-like isoform X1 [Danio rerio]
MIFLISVCALLPLNIVAFNNISADPCYNYEPLDRPWRATNESGSDICEEFFSWSGWYRLFYNGLDIRMPESCVSEYSCNAEHSLWLNGPHPKIEDGVVTRDVCGVEGSSCCEYVSLPIKVKACPGNYYVYEFVKTSLCSGYCIDEKTLSATTTATVTAINISLPAVSNTDDDPCLNYNILDDQNRSPNGFFFVYNSIYGYDDTRVQWQGWYRLFINGSNAQMPEWCFSSMSCGGFSSLWLGGSHPQLDDGVVTRDIYGSYFEVCSYYISDPIQVKACPGNYYVYKLVKPKQLIPAPTYCAVVMTSPPSVDPCYSYNSLDDPWRASSFLTGDHNNTRCDSDIPLNGWYRLFYNNQSAQMPESCVKSGTCGTLYPLWLDGPHPLLEDGVVTRKVCGSQWNDCCGISSHPIQVKACPGNYYVYEFVRPLYCAAYCADFKQELAFKVTTEELSFTEFLGHCSELNCTEDERCEEKDGIYGCSCKRKHQTYKFDFTETCESSHGSISLSRCQLFDAGFPSDVLHLNDPSCRGTVRDGQVEFYFDNNEHICGANIVENGTHIIYDNLILGESGTGPVISRTQFLKIHFQCVYSLEQTFYMNIDPQGSTVQGIVPAVQETYKVRMIPYKDAEFSQPFGSMVNISLNEQIFVEVYADAVDSLQVASVIDKCWATPRNDSDNSVFWDLIVDKCPNPNSQVKVLQNGVSISSRFSFNMSIFTENATEAYLYCTVHLCSLTNSNCSVDCGSGRIQREIRSVNLQDNSSVSVGPLRIHSNVKDIDAQNQVLVSMAASLCASLIMIVVSIIIVF